MNIIFNLIYIVICSIILLKCIKSIFLGKYSIFHFCCIVFYIMQILPIFISFFGDLSGIKKYYPYMYYSMVDFKVDIIYGVFCLVTMIILYYNASKFNKKYKLTLNFFKNNNKLSIISIFCIFIPLILGLLFSPNFNIYTKFSYFYTHEYLNSSSEYLYHINIMSKFVYISFISTIIYYYYKDSKKKNIVAYLATFLITWINGKRTLLVFLLFAFLAIDFIKWDRRDNKKLLKILKKALVFFGIFIVYYLIYNNITSKSNFADNYLLYSTYFSRMCNVKTAIYSLLYDHNMLNYSGETLLFNIFFYIPRSIWVNKPYPYFRQFTSYVFYGKPNITIPGMQFQVNIWSEFISNLGLLGYILALVFIKIIIKKSEKSNDKLIYFSGMLFILLYFMFGFEKIEQIILIFWCFMLFKKKIKIKF